ncbi:MAG: dUTP diphosphatase [Candidatus Moeniiplasma glomeromycotorum]|nr:dUTP diphosphatase [Candidatus Moeniiplasma glomeromycotorum]MCE8169179.1 dUTP diphosphatase [Candidatus Moeniiplasma glomeromycotorum]
MITKKTWEILSQKQAELGQLIMEKNPTDLQWISRFNAERLKLCLLVEIGEFANEIKSFKAWRKKTEINLDKTREELIDCLCFFFDLSNLFQVEPKDLSVANEKKEWHYNKLLLKLFQITNDLPIIEKEDWYNSKQIKLTEPGIYYEWLKIFGIFCEKLQIDEAELLTIYLQKNKKNQVRAKE